MYGAKLLKKTDQIPAVYCTSLSLLPFCITHPAPSAATAARTCSGTRSAASPMAKGQWTACGFVAAAIEIDSRDNHAAAAAAAAAAADFFHLPFTPPPPLFRSRAKLRRTCSRARAAAASPASVFICKFSSATFTSTTKVHLQLLRARTHTFTLLRPRTQACLVWRRASSTSCSREFRATWLQSNPRAR